MSTWEEIEIAIAENKHELHLNGELISQKLKSLDNVLPEELFALRSLNYLEVSNTSLASVQQNISLLDNLVNLALHRNEINSVPQTINGLCKLKFLDLSYNKITALPDALSLTNLHTLNLGNNLLESLPDFSEVRVLGILHIDHNSLTKLPTGLEKLANLSELYAAKNKINETPLSLTEMPSLKNLDLSTNEIKEVTVDLSLCKKLKDLNIKENPLKDNRLRKMTNQCNTKAVLEYISQHSGGEVKKSGKGKKGKNKKKEVMDEEYSKTIHVLQPRENCARQMVSKASVKNIRPFICCVVVKDLDLSDPAVFKKFINLQTKLHETECDMRTKATIATHNASRLTFPLTYEAVAPDGMQIIPLGKDKKASPLSIIERLKSERDALKLKKKRQPKTGLYKFIDLVDGKDEYACVRNANYDVISFPPVTNSEQTKITSDVSDVFIEVTSPISLPQCKYILEELVRQMFQLDFVSKNEQGTNGLILEKVSVVDEQGNLKIVYPSKIDLDFPPSIPVIRVEQLQKDVE